MTWKQQQLEIWREILTKAQRRKDCRERDRAIRMLIAYLSCIPAHHTGSLSELVLTGRISA
jgi:hypothetical protein